MLSEEDKKELAIFVKGEYGIDEVEFPEFVAKLESILDKHSQPAKKAEEPVIVTIGSTEYIKVPGIISRCNGCVGSFSYDLCQKLHIKCGKDDIFVVRL